MSYNVDTQMLSKCKILVFVLHVIDGEMSNYFGKYHFRFLHGTCVLLSIRLSYTSEL